LSWPITDDGQFYIFEGRVLIPIDPSTGVAQLLLRPQGGMGVAIPAIAQGDPGATPTISTTINLTELAYDDPTAASAEWVETSPDTYELSLELHAGEPGTAGTNATIIGASDLTGTPTYKDVITVNSSADGFEYTTPKVGDRHIPATISSIGAGSANATLCTITVPAQDFDWRPRVHGFCVIAGTGADVQMDLLARLDVETTGNIVARGKAKAGVGPETCVLIPGPAAGSAATYDKVNAGNAAVIYVRAERQSGTETFTTSSTTSQFSVEVHPIP
jgi:hypothetical protein